MSAITKIQWADHTWSPWRGCTKVSPGCANCYAESLAKRFGDEWGGWGKGKPRVESKSWGDPIRWNAEASRIGARPRVFPSLCDWLDNEVPVEVLARFLALISDTPNLDWLLLTKRPEIWMDRMLCVYDLWREFEGDSGFSFRGEAREKALWLSGWINGCTPPQNVWVGVSVEDQLRAEERVKELQAIPAHIRWLSCEPLLEPIDLQYAAFNGADSIDRIPGINWVVIGGESGPGARPCNIEWVRSVKAQCKTAGVPLFVKQLGANCKGSAGADYTTTDQKGGDPSEWPEELRVREFPI